MRARAGSGAVEGAVRALGLIAVVLVVVGAFTPLASAVNARMGGTPRLEPAEAIVVVARGGADADGVLTNRSMRRALLGIELYHRGLAPLLVFSGSDAEIRARLMLAQSLGVPADRMLAAAGGRTTATEAAALAGVLGPRAARRVLLVADPIDMPRTRLLLERRGLAILPAPTDSSGPGQPEARLELLRDLGIELVAWGYNRIAGRI